MKCRTTIFSSFLILLLAVAAPAAAQIGYFGQNKVQYQKFKFWS